MKTQNTNIQNFVDACNEFVDSKIILADIKISKILRAVADCDEIYNLVAESLINYDFQKQLQHIKEQNEQVNLTSLTLPKEREVVIPFVFSLLVEIDSKHLDFGEFLACEFPLCTSQKEEYENFGKQIVAPFRDAVASFFGTENFEDVFSNPNTQDKDENSPEEPPQQTEQQNDENQQNIECDENTSSIVAASTEHLSHEEQMDLLFGQLSRICATLKQKANALKKQFAKDNLNLTLSAIQLACQVGNLTIISALVLSLNNMVGKHKLFKNDIKQINSICYEFYN